MRGTKQREKFARPCGGTWRVENSFAGFKIAYHRDDHEPVDEIEVRQAID